MIKRLYNEGNMNSSALLISQNPTFSNFPKEDQAYLAREAIIRNYQFGEWIAQYGEIWPYIFLVDKYNLMYLFHLEQRWYYF